MRKTVAVVFIRETRAIQANPGRHGPGIEFKVFLHTRDGNKEHNFTIWGPPAARMSHPEMATPYIVHDVLVKPGTVQSMNSCHSLYQHIYVQRSYMFECFKNPLEHPRHVLTQVSPCLAPVPTDTAGYGCNLSAGLASVFELAPPSFNEIFPDAVTSERIITAAKVHVPISGMTFNTDTNTVNVLLVTPDSDQVGHITCNTNACVVYTQPQPLHGLRLLCVYSPVMRLSSTQAVQ